MGKNRGKNRGCFVDQPRPCHQIAAMMSDPGNLLFTLIPHCVLRGSVGFTMKLARVGLVSLGCVAGAIAFGLVAHARSEEHTSELQSRFDLVCRLLLEKKK